MVVKLDAKLADDKYREIERGVLNLLQGAINAKHGEKLLIVGEQGPEAHFDPDICQTVSDIARKHNLHVDVMLTDVGSGADDFPDPVSQAMQSVDHTVFFSRLGDQIRFCKTPGEGSKTMCYTPDLDYLASRFAQLPFGLSRRIHDRLVDKISQSEQFIMTCPEGTHLVGELADTSAAGGNTPKEGKALFTNFTVDPFPLAIFPPVTTTRMSGRLVIKRWLTSSSTINYSNSIFPVAKPVTAIVNRGYITRLEGDADVCRTIDRHLLNVAQIVGGEPRMINSWHAGILPTTWYKGRAEDNLERWSNVTFCSPRFTHFHACGRDPGHVAISLFDATIRFDDELVWDHGRFVFPFSPVCIDVFDDYRDWLNEYRKREDIGLPAG